MTEIPDNDDSYWLFADSIVEGAEYGFVEWNLKYKTRNNKEVPIIVLAGKVHDRTDPEKVLEGELLLSKWNIRNLKQLKQQLGKDIEQWTDNLRFTAKADGSKIILTKVEG